MDLGYFAMPMHPPGSDFTKTIHDDLDQILLLDQLGYQEAWIGEHFTTAWENIPCPELFIAAALEKTKNIVLGTGVTCLPNHNPFHIAHRIAQLDHQARGRFLWGIGSGPTPLDFEVWGIDAEAGEHRQLTVETIDMVLKIWEGLPPGHYENKFWRFTMPEPDVDVGFFMHMKPYQQPHPPIAVAGLGERSDTLWLAGERGWIPMSINYVPPRVLRTHWEALTEGAMQSGRTPQSILLAHRPRSLRRGDHGRGPRDRPQRGARPRLPRLFPPPARALRLSPSPQARPRPAQRRRHHGVHGR